MEAEYRAKELTAELRKEYAYGIKAYGSWDLFKTAKNYKAYLREWIAGTDGSERNRAESAYFECLDGTHYYDTDRDLICD